MTNKEKMLQQSFGIDVNKIKYFNSDRRAYIHIGAKLQNKLGRPTDTITANDRNALIEKLFDMLSADQPSTLNECFLLYSKWRFEIGTKSKTLKEDHFTWNRFFKSSIGDLSCKSITVPVIRDFFLTMTSENAITRKCFVSAKSVLNGVFQYCLEQGFMDMNPIDCINYNQFKKRFKPEETKKDYTREEVETIVCSLRSSMNVYDYAIRFAFNACMRFGELRTIRYEDMNDGMLTIRRSSSDVTPAFIDKNGRVAFAKTQTEETYTKGATAEGIRVFPLTPEAEEIIEELHRQHPNYPYVFMANGHQIKIVTFNRHLKKICEECHIAYRSSHVIRFTNCDTLYNEGAVSKQSLQSYMGHSSASMTDHYINQHRAKTIDNSRVVKCLTITKTGSK